MIAVSWCAEIEKKRQKIQKLYNMFIKCVEPLFFFVCSSKICHFD